MNVFLWRIEVADCVKNVDVLGKAAVASASSIAFAFAFDCFVSWVFVILRRRYVLEQKRTTINEHYLGESSECIHIISLQWYVGVLLLYLGYVFCAE